MPTQCDSRVTTHMMCHLIAAITAPNCSATSPVQYPLWAFIHCCAVVVSSFLEGERRRVSPILETRCMATLLN